MAVLAPRWSLPSPAAQDQRRGNAQIAQAGCVRIHRARSSRWRRVGAAAGTGRAGVRLCGCVDGGGVHAADPQLAQWIVLSHLRDHHRHHGPPLSGGWGCRRVAKTACFYKPATSHNIPKHTWYPVHFFTETYHLSLLKFTEFSLLHTEKIQRSATLFPLLCVCSDL